MTSNLEILPTPRPPLKVLLGQRLRKLIKNTVWQTITAIPKLLGHPLQTIQVLVVDRKKKQVLLLRTPESKTGYFPVQGLRSGVRWSPLEFGYQADAREDARRELAEEAVATALDLEEFHFQHRYREGSHAQFDCRIYAVDADSETLKLVAENTEGLPIWMGFDNAYPVLNKTVGAILAQLPPASLAIEHLDRLDSDAGRQG